MAKKEITLKKLKAKHKAACAKMDKFNCSAFRKILDIHKSKAMGLSTNALLHLNEKLSVEMRYFERNCKAEEKGILTNLKKQYTIKK